MTEKYIAFIGDSFCADYQKSKCLKDSSTTQSQGVFENACWTTDLAQQLDLHVIPCGFGGMSWWHSRSYFMKHYWNNRDFRQQDIEVLVFCHTAPNRINCVGQMGLTAPSLSAEQTQNLVWYYDHLYDENFAYWARDQYFLEIAREFSHIKTVHLMCFNQPQWVSGFDALPGIKFHEPLVWITVGELTGTTDQVQMALSKSRDRNHMSTRNNQVLAQQLCQHIKNYSPGERNLDMSQFVLTNHNYRAWPHGNFGTHE